MKPEHYTECFFNKFSRKISNNGDRLTTYIHARVRCTRASQRTHRWGFVAGVRETTPCALQARRVVFPLAQVDLEHQQRHVADGGCPRPRQARVVCLFCLVSAQSRLRGEWQGSRSHDHRSHRFVVRPEVCASGQLDTVAAPRVRLWYVLLAQQTEIPDACLASSTTTVVLLLFSAHKCWYYTVLLRRSIVNRGLCLIMLQQIHRKFLTIFAISRSERHIFYFLFSRRDRKAYANNPSYRLPLSTKHWQSYDPIGILPLLTMGLRNSAVFGAHALVLYSTTVFFGTCVLLLHSTTTAIFGTKPSWSRRNTITRLNYVTPRTEILVKCIKY